MRWRLWRPSPGSTASTSCSWVPRDLSLALGVPGDLTATVYTDALERVLAAARQHGKAAGLLVSDGSAARAMADRGWQFLAVGSDTTLLANAVASHLRVASGEQP